MNDSDSDDEPPVLVTLEDEKTPQPPLPLLPQAAVESTSEELPPCPVTILSGFLGSGKTTLIQYILKSPDHGKRIAVIENEFGDGLSVESLIARDGVNDDLNGSDDSDSKGRARSALQDLIELPNGCICCTVKDGLVTTLENLIQKRNDLDYILIEASGMANPGPIASVFWLDDELQSRIRLDGIVTLVDAYHIHQQLQETYEASQQVAYADRILINKIDLLSSQSKSKSDTEPAKNTVTLEDVVASIRSIHPTAPYQTTTYSQIPDLDWILDAQCFGGKDRVQELDRVLNDAAAIEEPQQQQNHSHDHSHDHDHDESCKHCHENVNTVHEEHHRHTNAVSTIALNQKGTVDLAKMNTWLAELLWPNQDAPNKVLKAILDEQEKELAQSRIGQDEKGKAQPEETTTAQSQSPPKGQTIFRIKGILSVQHADISCLDDNEVQEYLTQVTTAAVPGEGAPYLDARRYIVQAVHDLWDIHPASNDLRWDCHDIVASGADSERSCKLVVIGRGLKEAELRAGFQSCFA